MPKLLFYYPKKLSAFTVIELMVVILLTTLIAALGYLGIQKIMRSYSTSVERNKKQMEYWRFDETIRSDIWNTERVYAGVDGIILQTSQQEIAYQFTQDSVAIRKVNTLQDTFRIQCHDLTTLFKGKAAYTPHELLDEITFMAQFKNETIHMRYTKIYPAEVLLNERKRKLGY